MKKKHLPVIICLILLILPIHSEAATKVKKGSVYNEVIKIGKYAYCSSGYTLYRVNLKRNKVKTLYAPRPWTGDYFVGSMRLKGKYLYYIFGGENVTDIYRLNLKTGKRKRLTGGNGVIYDYVISGKRIYYRSMLWTKNEPTVRRVMKCNGKSKKKTNYRAKMVRKNTNKAGKGYRVVGKYVDSVWRAWLTNPNGKKVYLGSLK